MFNIIDFIVPLLGFVFGGTSLIALIAERKKRDAENKRAQADALRGMQEAYSVFVQDNEARLKAMHDEIESLKEEAVTLRDLLDKERAKSKMLQGKYNNLQMLHGKLKREFEIVKNKQNAM